MMGVIMAEILDRAAPAKKAIRAAAYGAFTYAAWSGFAGPDDKLNWLSR